MRAFTILATAIALVFLTSILLAPEAQAQTITVTAAVRPLRTIIVDKNLLIQKIVSNTSEDIRPMVVLAVADGEELPYSESIQKQYEFLKPSLDFSKPGIIYTREDRFLQWLRWYLTMGLRPFKLKG